MLRILSVLEKYRRRRIIITILVYLALLLDNMLLTVVVPIIPDYLYQQELQQINRQQYYQNLTQSANWTEYFNTTDIMKLDKTNDTISKRAVDNLDAINSMDIIQPDEGDKTNTAKTKLDIIQPDEGDKTNTAKTKLDIIQPDEGDKTNTAKTKLDIIQPDEGDNGNTSLVKSQTLDKNPTIPLDKITVNPTIPFDKTIKLDKINRNTSLDKHTTLDKYPTISFDKITGNPTIPLDKITANPTIPLDETNPAIPLDKINENTSIDKNPTIPLDNITGNPFIPLDKSPTIPLDKTTNLDEMKADKITLNKNPTIPLDKITGNPTVPLDKSPAVRLDKTKLPQHIINENKWVGFLFSSKAFVQLLSNPIIGRLTSQIGYCLPLAFGTQNLIISALLYAYAESYNLMFLARSLQGVASSCIAIAGMGLVAECYPDDNERGRMQGIVMGGIALGVMAGYPLGSLLYDFTNSKTPPFLLVAGLTVLLAVTQLAILNLRPQKEKSVDGSPLLSLAKDPYIIVTAGAIMISTSTLAVLEPCLPIWLTSTLHPQKWQLGTAFLPDSIGYFLGTTFTAGPAYKIGRWRLALIAMIMLGIAAACVPEASNMVYLAGPHLVLGLGVGTVDAALIPHLAALADGHHVSAYGAVYAMAQIAVALAYFLGPLVGGSIVEKIGFPWLMRTMAILNFCYSPILCCLNNTTDHSTPETQAILMSAPCPQDYTKHITSHVQPRRSSLKYTRLFEDED